MYQNISEIQNWKVNKFAAFTNEIKIKILIVQGTHIKGKVDVVIIPV